MNVDGMHMANPGIRKCLCQYNGGKYYIMLNFFNKLHYAYTFTDQEASTSNSSLLTSDHIFSSIKPDVIKIP